MNLLDYHPGVYERNETVMERIAQIVDGDLIDATEAVLRLLDLAGWRWDKPAGYYGAVIDHTGDYHLLHFAQSFIDAVACAFRLLLQYVERGWVVIEAAGPAQ